MDENLKKIFKTLSVEQTRNNVMSTFIYELAVKMDKIKRKKENNAC